MIFISCSDKDSFETIGKHYKFQYDGQNDIFLFDVDTTAITNMPIHGHILFYTYNSDFIITDQKPRDSILEMFSGLDYDESKDKFFKSDFKQYLIIALKNDSIYGPYKKKQYLEMRKELNVPDTLKLDHSTLEFYIKGQRRDVGYDKLDSEIIDVKNLQGNKVSKMKFPFNVFE